MNRFSEMIRIDAPKEKVWAKIADLGAIQDYSPSVSKSYYTSESKEGVGSSRHCSLLPFGEVEERILDWKDGEEYTIEIYEGEKVPPFKTAIGRMSVEADGGSSMARFTLEYDMKYGLFGWLLDRLMVRRKFSKVPSAVLKGLKRYMENGENPIGRTAASKEAANV
jgi:hypothetical protein